MYRRILVPHDGSPVSSTAIPYAGSLARLFGAEVVALRVSLIAGDTIDTVDDNSWERSIAAPPDSSLLDVTTSLREAGAGSVGSLMLHGDPPSVIAAVAERARADLVVMASHGRSGWKRAILGSVADHVSRDLHRVPVLLCKPLSPDTSSPFAQVAVPIDGSPFAGSALSHVEGIRSAAGSTTHVIRVIEHEGSILSTAVPIASTDPLPSVSDRTDASGQRAAREVDPADILVSGMRMERVDGGIASGILSAARSAGCGTIVMSTQGRSGISRSILGSVGDEVARNAETGGVLLVRANSAASS